MEALFLDSLTLPQLFEACRMGMDVVVLQDVQMFPASAPINIVADACSAYHAVFETALDTCMMSDEAEVLACVDQALDRI